MVFAVKLWRKFINVDIIFNRCYLGLSVTDLWNYIMMSFQVLTWKQSCISAATCHHLIVINWLLLCLSYR